jgi:hypothetical protein
MPRLLLPHSTSKISTQTNNAAPAPESDVSKVHLFQPRTQPKTMELPKEPRAHESRKQSPHKQSLSGQYRHCADEKGDGAPPNPRLSCEDQDMDTSDTINWKHILGRNRRIPSCISYDRVEMLQWNVNGLRTRIPEFDIIRRRYALAAVCLQEIPLRPHNASLKRLCLIPVWPYGWWQGECWSCNLRSRQLSFLCRSVANHHTSCCSTVLNDGSQICNLQCVAATPHRS